MDIGALPETHGQPTGGGAGGVAKIQGLACRGHAGEYILEMYSPARRTLVSESE